MYGASGYDEIIGALDELDALDAVAGDDYASVGDGELEAIAGYRHHRHHHGYAGYDEIIGDGGDADIGADDELASLMAAAGAAPHGHAAPHHAMPHHGAPPRPYRHHHRLRHPHYAAPHAHAASHAHPYPPHFHAPPHAHAYPPHLHPPHAYGYPPHALAYPPPHAYAAPPYSAPPAPTHPGVHPGRLIELGQRLALARQVDPHAVAVVQRPQDRRREFPVGLVAPGPTAPGSSAQATAFPQVTFRPERLVIPSQIGPFFTVDAIIVGKDNQSVSFDPIPATMFSEVGVGVRLNLKTAVVGMQIIIRFTNVDPLGQPRTFSGGIIGTAVE